MDLSKVDQLIQYGLLIAGQTERRWLGRIHLVKYVYLADVAYAMEHAGQTFTGARWQFYHYGPWNADVHERVEPALQQVGAETRSFEGDYGEFVRYSLRNERLLGHFELTLPLVVAKALKHAVTDFGGDTPRLLNHVYLTDPMLRAAPHEYLVFEPREMYERTESSVAEAKPLTARERKQRREGLERMRAELTRRLKEKVQKKARMTMVTPAPRYDEVFFEGVKWLDGLAGEPMEPQSAIATFTQDVWKAPGRGEPDVP